MNSNGGRNGSFVYRDAGAREFHLQQPYFLKFKEAVIGQEMFARKGTGDEFDLLFPDQDAA